MSRQPNFASLVQPMLPQRDGGGGGGGAIIAAAAAADGAAIRTGMSNAEHVDPTPRRVDDHIVVALDPITSSFTSILPTSVGRWAPQVGGAQNAALYGGPPC